MAPKLVNMKSDPPDAKAEKAMMLGGEAPMYPYGLSLSLDDEALEKLGVTTLPDVGATMMIIAKVDITDVSSMESRESDGPIRSVRLQITDLCLEKENSKAASAVLYDKKD